MKKTELIQLGNPSDTHGAILTEGFVLKRRDHEIYGKGAYVVVPINGYLYCADAVEMRQAPDFWQAGLYSTHAQPRDYIGTVFGEEIGELYDNFLKTEEAEYLIKLEPKQVKGKEYIAKSRRFKQGLASV